jgi:hypothetical protein
MMKEATGTGLSAQYHKTRFDLSEGREWLVRSDSGHEYVVTVWVESGLGRIASCRCRAFQFGVVCKHIRFVAKCDSYLTGAPVREVQGVAA